MESLATGLGRAMHLSGEGRTSSIEKTQANAFRGCKPSLTVEHDFVFTGQGEVHRR